MFSTQIAVLLISHSYPVSPRYDEGTAFMPVVENKRMLPESDKYPFMALDEDGYDLPSDWLVLTILTPHCSPQTLSPSMSGT